MGPAGARYVGIAPVVPVGVSREDEAWSLAMGIPAFNDLPAQFQQDIHAAILAALRQPVVPIGVSETVLKAAQSIHNAAIIYEDEALLEDAEIVLAALRLTDTERE
jgi:hypothetical protein